MVTCAKCKRSVALAPSRYCRPCGLSVRRAAAKKGAKSRRLSSTVRLTCIRSSVTIAHMHTVEKGDLSVAMLTARLLQKRIIVLKPMSELQRYDLVIDRGSGFERVQCKTGRLRNGAIRFNTCSSQAHHKNGVGRRSYSGEADLFGVYCPETEKCYLVPEMGLGSADCTLRISAPGNGQKTRIRLATDFEL